MQKDLKIGLTAGLCLMVAAVLWFAARPSINTKTNVTEFTRINFPEKTPIKIKPLTELKAPQPKRPSQKSPEEKPAQPSVVIHTVGRNETLSGISGMYYGTTTKWKKIYEANRNTIKNPDVLKPGTKLIIPTAD